jgi:hypothetical protein
MRKAYKKEETKKKRKGGRKNLKYWPSKAGLPIPVLRMIIKPSWGEFMSTQILRSEMIVF